MTTPRTSISIIVPVLDEEEILPLFLRELTSVADSLNQQGYSVEVIFNDNCSRDRSADILQEFELPHTDIVVHEFARNYGFQESLLFGMKHARGDCVVILQSDLQDPPHLVLEMVSAWQSGALTVGARPLSRNEHWSMRVGRRFFYALLAAGSGHRDVKGILDFYLLDRLVVDEAACLPYQGVFLRGWLAETFGWKQVISYDRAARSAGKSKFGLTSLYEIGMNGLLLHSQRFIRLLAVSGLILAVISGLGLVAVGVAWLIGMRVSLGGWFSLTSFLLLLVGMNSMGFALVLEYLSRSTRMLVSPIHPQVVKRR